MAAPKQTDPQFKLRMTPEIKDQIEIAAKQNNRSLNAEIIARLEAYDGFSKSLEASEKRAVEAEASRDTLFTVNQFVVGILASATGNESKAVKLVADAIRTLVPKGEDRDEALAKARAEAVRQLADSLALANETGLDKLGIGVIPDRKKAKK